jgi:hypothetical protein
VLIDMSMRETFQTKIAAQLASWEGRLAELRNSAGDKVNENFETALAEWKVALARLNELKLVTGERWRHVKLELEKACHGIAAALGESPSTRITEPGMAAVVPEGEEKHV